MAKKPVPISPTDFDDRRVLTIKQFLERNSLSKTTWHRLRAAGRAPKTVQLSAQRLGIRVCDERAWQESRLSA